ncbi:MAG: prolipoprotein diacylglyceryl transferase, partial [Pseudomonadota bacterium]
ENPGAILRIWEGGMAFHGGLMGVVVATAIYTWRNGLPFFSVSDALCAATPPGLFLGRIANFINAELWGRPSDAPWAVIFPGLDAQDCPGPEGLVERGGQILCARHPSQLYESGLEGLFLGLILLWLIVARRWLHRPGLITGAFFAGYGAARIFVEAFRQADPQFITPDNPWGHVIDLGPIGLTMGQVLSLPMLLFGLGVMATATLHRRANA